MTDGISIFDDARDAGSARDADNAFARDADSALDADADAAAPKKRPWWPGALSGGVAILMVFSWAAGLALLSANQFEFGLGLTVSAILLSVIAIVAGAVAAIGNYGRGWGIAGLAVGVLLNPVLLLLILSWLGAL